jgi:hypothetical protein
MRIKLAESRNMAGREKAVSPILMKTVRHDQTAATLE